MIRELARVGLRNAVRRKRVAALTLLSIAFSVSLLYTALSASNSLQQSANLFLRDTSSPVDIIVASTATYHPITQEMIASIAAVPSVKTVVPRIEEYAQFENASSGIYVALVGIDEELENNIGSLNATEGSTDLSASGCFLTRECVELLNVTIGEELMLHTMAGLRFFNVTGYGLAVDKGVIGPVIFISLENAWKTYHIRYPDHSSNKLLVELNDVFATPTVAEHVKALCGEKFSVTNLKIYPVKVASVFLGQARTILFALVAASCFISAYRVFSSFVIMFGQRRYETGVFLAFGATRFNVLVLLLSEIGIIGVVGAILGITLGVGVAAVILNFVVTMSRIIIVAPTTQYFQSIQSLDPWSILGACGIGIALTLLAGYMPAWRASHDPVVASLGSSPLPSASRQTARAPIARRRLQYLFMVMTLGLTSVVVLQTLSDVLSIDLISYDALRILSIPAFLLVTALLSPRLAHSQKALRPLVAGTSDVIRTLSKRNLRRNALAGLVVFNLFAAATVLYFASTNVGYVVTESWRRNVGGQTTSANVVVYMDPPADMELLAQISGIPNVTSAVPMNQALETMWTSSGIEMGLLLGVEPAGFEQMASLGITRSANMSRGLGVISDNMTCVISEDAAQRFAVSLGGVVRVASGANLTVVAVCASSVPVFALTIISHIFVIVGTQTWASIYGGAFRIGSFLIQSSDPAATLAQLSGVPDAHPVLVSSLQADYVSALRSIELVVNASLAALFATTLASALLSSWAAASSRRRELGMLASLGMRRQEIARTLTAESAASMISGVLVGSIVGLLVEISLRDIILRFSGGFYILVDIRTVLLVTLSLVMSIAASYYMTSKACNTEVVRLLHESGRGK